MDKSKIMNLRVLQINYNITKHCSCYHPHYEIDHQNRMVRCLDCGALLEPFEALTRLARYFEEDYDLLEQTTRMIEKLKNYKPKSKEIMALEQRYVNSIGLLPSCPHCNQTFQFSDIVTFQQKGRRNDHE